MLGNSKIYNIFGVFFLFLAVFVLTSSYGCNYATHRILSKDAVQNTANDDDDPEPDYNYSLDENYQEFVSFIFMGNRSATFSTYFNKFFTALEDYDEALKEYKTTTIATYNRRLDSLNIAPVATQSTKDKFTKVIERCSKVIQFNKNTKFLDDAVLLIGKSYYYSGEYLQAERKFSEFLSKLSKSELYDEALLYLGLTKIRMNNIEDGKTLLANLFKSTTKDEIKADINGALCYVALAEKKNDEAIKFMKTSIDFTKDKEMRAQRIFILGKIYSFNNQETAAAEFEKAFKLTSDFDLEFYARLNEAKSYIAIKRFNKSGAILKKMSKQYLDYPEYLQLVELEIANSYFYRKEFRIAKEKYFEIIVKYPGSKASADSYYFLGNYYENNESNYFKALLSYKRVNETNATSDFSTISNKLTTALDKYFTLQAIINDTVKITLPPEEPELEKFKKKYEEEKNKDLRKEGNEFKGGDLKGGGFRILFNPSDSIESEDSLLNAFIKKLDSTGVNKETQKEHSSDDDGKEKKNNVVNEDSIRTSKDEVKMNAYFQMAELFFYELNKPDSSIHYLNFIVNNYDNEKWTSKALFYLGAIYRNLNDSLNAQNYFRKVIEKYPETVFANESRKILGLSVIELKKDESEELFALAEDYFFNKNDKDKAVKTLKELTSKYPESIISPRAVFFTGWIFENAYLNLDSAIYYYKIVAADFPNSEQAKTVSGKLSFYENYFKKDTITSGDDTTINRENQIDSLGNTGKNINGEEKKENNSENEELKNNGNINNPEMKKEEELKSGENKPEEIKH